jgi:hypothetical protein
MAVMLTGREFYEDWSRRRGAGRDYDAPKYDTLDIFEKRLWSELAAKVGRRKEYTLPADEKPDHLKNWGVNLQKPVRNVGEADKDFFKDDVVKGFFEGARFVGGVGSTWDQLISANSPGRPRDIADEAGAALTRNLEGMAGDEKLQAAIVTALDTVDFRKAFIQAFFEHVVDDELLFAQ